MITVSVLGREGKGGEGRGGEGRGGEGRGGEGRGGEGRGGEGRGGEGKGREGRGGEKNMLKLYNDRCQVRSACKRKFHRGLILYYMCVHKFCRNTVNLYSL